MLNHNYATTLLLYNCASFTQLKAWPSKMLFSDLHNALYQSLSHAHTELKKKIHCEFVSLNLLPVRYREYGR